MLEKYKNCEYLFNDIYSSADAEKVFDDELVELCKKIDKDIENFTNDDIETLICKYPNENIFKTLILKKSVPLEYIREMMKEIKHDGTLIDLLNKEYMHPSIIDVCLKRLGKENVIWILKDGLRDGKRPFSQQVIDYITRKYPKMYDYITFAFTNELDLAKRYVEKETYPNALIYIANNEKLDEEIRELAYEKDSNYEKMYNPTVNIMEENYRIAIETLTEYENDITLIKERESALHFISESIKKEQITESCQLDLLHQCDSTLLNKKNEIINEMAVNTDSNEVLAKIVTNKDATIDQLLLSGLNKNAPSSVVKLSMFNATEKIAQISKNKIDDKTKYYFQTMLKKFIDETKFSGTPTDVYEKIIKMNIPEFSKVIIANENTPFNALHKLKESKNPHLSFLANIAIHLKGTSVANRTSAIINTIDNYDVSLPKPKTRVMDYKDERKLDSNFQFRRLKQVTPEEYKKIKKALEQSIKGDDSATHNRKIKIFNMELDYYFQKEQQFNKIPFIKFENGQYQLDIDKAEGLTFKDIKNYSYSVKYHDIHQMLSGCKSIAQQMYEENIPQFYSNIENISNLYFNLDTTLHISRPEYER